MSLRAGDLRDQVTIKRKTMTPTGSGGFAEAWVAIATVWAQVVGISGREAVIGQALQGISSYKVVTRYLPDVGDGDQLEYQLYGAAAPITLNIRSVTDPDGRREQLLILADTGSVQAAS